MCVSPKNIKGYTVPCGRCFECQMKRRAEWTARMKLEHLYNENAYFLTLTYDDAHISALEYVQEADLYLPNKKHYQNFLKRLRKDYEVRYFGVHEYGSRTGRCHYHIILFFPHSDVKLCADSFTKYWEFGFISCDKLNSARMHYVTKYLQKPFRQIPYFKRDPKNLFKELRERDMLMSIDDIRDSIMYRHTFNFMSTKPAIGYNLLEDTDMVDYIVAFTLNNMRYPNLSVFGETFPLPRYYIKKIFPDDLREMVYLNGIGELQDSIFDDAEKNELTIYQLRYNREFLSELKLKRFNSNNLACDLI